MRIPILLRQHSSNISRIEVDTLMRKIIVFYLNLEQETRTYTENEWEASIIIFNIETSNKSADLAGARK